MFYQFQLDTEKNKYREYLNVTARLSNLFSTSQAPYVNYRVHESVFCRAFHAKDLSRSDIAFDAQIGTVGFGLKTFLYGNGSSFQKVAEFNAKAPELAQLQTPREIVEKVASWRNERIDFSLKAYGINKALYHCLVRRDGELLIYEEPMNRIEDITDVEERRNAISFKSNGEEYSFLRSKNTLTKKFIILDNEIQDVLPVSIYEHPLDILLQIPDTILNLQDKNSQYNPSEKQVEFESVILPLYTTKGGEKYVPTKSHVNQWNAGGRRRHPDEAYIAIPSVVRNHYSDFFPPRDREFQLELTDGRIVRAKVCQEGSKALMTNPNKDLGHWIKATLGLVQGELITMDMLDVIEIDSVVVYKKLDSLYSIDFAKTNSFEDFKNNL